MQTGIVADGAGQVGFATATGAGDQQVLSLINPVSLGQLGDLRLTDVARMLLINILYAGFEFKACLSDQSVLFAVFTGQIFFIE